MTFFCLLNHQGNSDCNIFHWLLYICSYPLTAVLHAAVQKTNKQTKPSLIFSVWVKLIEAVLGKIPFFPRYLQFPQIL